MLRQVVIFPCSGLRSWTLCLAAKVDPCSGVGGGGTCKDCFRRCPFVRRAREGERIWRMILLFLMLLLLLLCCILIVSPTKGRDIHTATCFLPHANTLNVKICYRINAERSWEHEETAEREKTIENPSLIGGKHPVSVWRVARGIKQRANKSEGKSTQSSMTSLMGGRLLEKYFTLVALFNRKLLSKAFNSKSTWIKKGYGDIHLTKSISAALCVPSKAMLAMYDFALAVRWSYKNSQLAMKVLGSIRYANAPPMYLGAFSFR